MNNLATDVSFANPTRKLPMLLLEPDPLLRRTVSLTARSLDLCEVCEASTPESARRLLLQYKFCGAIIALDLNGVEGSLRDLRLLDDIRERTKLVNPNYAEKLPVAVMLPGVDSARLQVLRERGVTRIILKPFRARILIDTFASFVAPLQQATASA